MGILFCLHEMLNKTGNIRTNERNSEVRSRNHCCREKAKSITYSDCESVAFVIQHAQRMRRVILSSVASLALLYFTTLSLKWHDFREKKITEHKMRIFISLKHLSKTFIILRKIQRAIINARRSSCT
jgi:predicted histidine transporter YuiF (NhaC family)